MIGGVWAMARPRRPASERELVRAAADAIRDEARNLSATRLAALIARRVMAEIVREYNREPEEFVSLAYRLAAMLEPSPIMSLATDPDIDTAALFRRARLERFEARGCRHLPAAEWASEDRDIVKGVSATLAGRYSRYL